MSRLFLAVLMCAIALLASRPAAAGQTATIEKGMKVYTEQKCSLCHSIAGKGNKKGALDDVGAKLTAEEIRKWIVTPKEMTEKTKATRKPPMKAYPNLSKEDVDALVAYLSTLKAK